MSLDSAVARLSASFQEERNGRKRIVVYDCRREHREASEMLETNGLDFNAFLQRVSKEFAIHSKETFVLTTTDRTVLDFDGFEELQDGNTLHLWQREDQVLPGATEEHIVFLPHYDTLVRSGMYEYYASSDGQKSLPYALAELIDNALSATARNKGVRAIEIRLLFDETLGKPAVIVLDNGCGMTSKQLNNWAVYRLSKFTRESNTFASNQKSYVRPDHVPRSLNSDISYFGVGGKQAGFYIGESTRMITKPMGFPDVHELIISKEEFERKEKNKEDIYRGVIRNRKPGDHSHVKQEDEGVLHDLIAEECGKESFTAVVITGIQPEHITFLKQDFPLWTRELAHLYHYYIHGFNGNDMRPCSQNTDRLHNIDIQIYLREKPPRCPRVLNLREIDNDMQTLYINSSTDTFEFKASTEDHGTVEGVLRYHPFLYDKETYPQEADAELAPIEDDDDNDSGVVHQARGKRPIFECFWNGRLIPYTTISEFEWCARPKKAGAVPAECYSRVSGVLFTDDRFQVSTNKLTFMDLELQLKNKDTIFTRIVKGQEQRVNIQREFAQWLKKCHESWDKQVKFLGFKGTITRTDAVPKKMQHPWATFSSIALDGKRYKTGQYVRSQKTQPIFFGSVVQFLLYGDHDGDVYATGGQVQIALEPKALYNEFKTIPICKIDRTTTVAAIKKSIDNELNKLPHKLNVEWPEGNAWSENAVHPAGTPLGPLQVTILNKKGETLSRMPSVSQGTVKKLLMELKVVWHGPFGDQETNSHIAQHSKWAFWFKPMENLTKLGKYTLYLNTMLNESNDSSFGGTQLPSYKLQFTITEGSAHTFVVGAVSSPLHVGVPFNIPLELLDVYGHPTQPPTDLKPVLECSGLDLSYEGLDTNGTTFTIRNVKARGKIQNYHSKTYDLKVVLPGLRLDTQMVKIGLLPGNPHSLHVTPVDNSVTIENGNPLRFYIEVHDEAGNITTHSKMIVRCQVRELPLEAIDCSNTGTGHLVTKPVNLKNINGDQYTFKAKFDVPSQKHIAVVYKELTVVPSTRVFRIEVYRQDDDDLLLKDKDKIEWEAGDLLENLRYRLYDEGGRKVSLTPELTSKIKVNWTADVSLQDLAKGNLPDVHVPIKVQDEHFYQVSYQDQHVSVNTSFTIVPRPNEPKHLKATLSQSTVRMGEILPGKINLELMDQYGNVTKTLTSTCVDHFTVKADGLERSTLAITWEESSHSVVVTGVQFQSGTPGTREMCFTFRSFVEHALVKVTAGVPAQLRLISGPGQPLQVLNEKGIPTPFLIQLCDEWGNPSPDQRVVVALKSSFSALKVRAAVMSQPVDAEGKTTFTVQSVSGPKGEYELHFKGSFNKKPLSAPSVKLTVIPDPNKPVSLAVDYDSTSKLPAGGIFPVFSVTVVSDEGSPIQHFNPAAASMFLWKRKASETTPPHGVGHLALVEDDAAAVVLSWHIMGDMDCVITKTTAAARRIYDDTQGRQQVMPLDSVYWNPNNRSLPHIKYGRSTFQPIGNPRFARDLLIYSGDQESCNMVFKNLLGDTILIDDLDSANNYRKAVMQNKTPCPTILTRQGERISAKGKFGGTQNKAPPIERLHGQVFGAPLPQRYHTLQGQIEQLGLYRSALQKKEQAKKDRDNHILKLSAPDVVQKEEEMEEKKQQLEEIERKLVPQEAPLPRKPLGHLDRLQPQQGAQGLGLGHCIHQLLQSEFPTGRAPPASSLLYLSLQPAPPGPVACSTWTSSLLYLSLQPALPGPVACSTWTSSLLYLSLQPAPPGPVACSTWTSSLPYLSLQPAPPGNPACFTWASTRPRPQH
ncbi:structural maintenance of chromosomes flexible hinge domain-containing protein 1-like [Diretmus argenteus]